MRLASFIRAELPRILDEWDRFARSTSPIEAGLTDLVLRDHAKEMLLAIAVDVETPQSAAEQQRKSEGKGDPNARSAASTHGTQRHHHEFSLSQLGAEFRALRSTVLRLWLPQTAEMSETTVMEVVRFNEAIDQALAESLVAYTEAMNHVRQLLLAVLGHDLRSPLANVSMSATMLALDELSTAQRLSIAHRVQRSTKLMTSMVNDLLGYTLVQFAKRLPIRSTRCNVSEIIEAAKADAQATHPRLQFDMHVEGDLLGCYDGARLHQLFMNLLVNAGQHGERSSPVVLRASMTPDQLIVHITNQGRAIPEASLTSIFKPLVQLEQDASADDRPNTSLGLGLFIAREIAEGHGGTLTVESVEVSGTTFTVRLPRGGEEKPQAYRRRAG